jgi:nucleotide-binding universal stress UspA family protein
VAKRILVPLDQSLAAESIVPVVADAARGGGATVRLLHVAPPPDNLLGANGRVVAYADQEMARLTAEGMDYLRAIEARFFDGVAVECAVAFGHPVDAILAQADEFGADLIAVTTTGRSGLRRAAFGSVADQVFRKAEVGVLMLHASHGGGS